MAASDGHVLQLSALSTGVFLRMVSPPRRTEAKDICLPCIPTSLKVFPFLWGFASFAGSALQYAWLLVPRNLNWFRLDFNKYTIKLQNYFQHLKKVHWRMVPSGMGLHWCPMSPRTFVWTKWFCSGDPEELLCLHILFFSWWVYAKQRQPSSSPRIQMALANLVCVSNVVF